MKAERLPDMKPGLKMENWTAGKRHTMRAMKPDMILGVTTAARSAMMKDIEKDMKADSTPDTRK